MAPSATSVIQRLARKVFTKPPGTSVTVHNVSVTSGTLSGYGGSTKAITASTAVIGVPYGYISAERQYYSFGRNVDGETKIALPASTTISEGDYITSNVFSKTMEVTQIQDYPYHDGNLATIVTVKEMPKGL